MMYVPIEIGKTSELMRGIGYRGGAKYAISMKNVRSNLFNQKSYSLLRNLLNGSDVIMKCV